jgi:acyl carrier protein
VGTDDIRRFIVDSFLFGDGDRLHNDTSFLECGIIDSTAMLELILFLETHYGITIADEELRRENLDSLDSISRFLDGKLNQQPASEH